jgi:hypothetical protein
MKVTWEANDIRYGIVLGLPTGAREQFIIGYLERYKHKETGIWRDRSYCLVSLADGLVQTYDSVTDLLDTLNSSQLVPSEIHSYFVNRT